MMHRRLNATEPDKISFALKLICHQERHKIKYQILKVSHEALFLTLPSAYANVATDPF